MTTRSSAGQSSAAMVVLVLFAFVLNLLGSSGALATIFPSNSEPQLASSQTASAFSHHAQHVVLGTAFRPCPHLKPASSAHLPVSAHLNVAPENLALLSGQADHLCCEDKNLNTVRYSLSRTSRKAGADFVLPNADQPIWQAFSGSWFKLASFEPHSFILPSLRLNNGATFQYLRTVRLLT